MKKNIVDFKEVEKKARLREIEEDNLKYVLDHGGVSQDQIESAIALLSKATGKDHYIGTKRAPQSRVRFVQSMQENLQYLYEKEYLTGREKIFFMDITPYIAFSSNCIVIDIKAKNPVPANISEIAKLIGSARQNTSTVINSLVKKGLIFKGESGVEGNNAKAYAIFVNPHILYAGDKECVNEALQVMFHKAMKMPILKDLPDKLF
ncbi:MarR family transcriptional regulator [Pseudobacillus badius]|uniref:MarR family transcriptional regulator n=1 Tax=Bacillus badius TaxID=1455 RepID=UPI000AEE995F|nr:MarR family transcriptional regulator [Bacillus badius]MED0668485.1 MarR family transcriptional regulator [Bacillus badius]